MLLGLGSYTSRDVVSKFGETMTAYRQWPMALLAPLFFILFLFSISLFATTPKHSSRVLHCQTSFGPPQGYRTLPMTIPSSASSGDYLRQVNQDGSFRWTADRLPLTVYIDDGRNVPGYKPAYKQMVAQAFDEWCSQSNGLISWRLVSNSRGADIVCTWTDNPTIKPGAVEAGQTRTLVQTNRYSGTGQLVHAEISILTELMGRSFTDSNMYKTCLHEVGHALGLQGHSDVPSDIMFPSVNDTQVAELKARDVNTLVKLYDGGYADSMAQAPATDRWANGSGRKMPWPSGQGRGFNGGFYANQGDSDQYANPDQFGTANGGNRGQWWPGQQGMANNGSQAYPMRPHHRHGWNRDAAIREYIRRSAEQPTWYN